MTIESFKELAHEDKLNQLRHHGELLGTYERRSADGDRRRGRSRRLITFYIQKIRKRYLFNFI